VGKRVSFVTKSGKRVSFTVKKGAGPKRKTVRRRSKVVQRIRSSINRRRRSGSKVTKHKKSGGRRPGGKKSVIDRIPVLRNKTVQKVAFGLGMGALVVQGINLLARFAPPAVAQPLQQNQRIIKLATEFATEPISGVVDLVIPMLAGNGAGLSSGGMNTNMAGFA